MDIVAPINVVAILLIDFGRAARSVGRTATVRSPNGRGPRHRYS
jgi:hypothetical protein